MSVPNSPSDDDQRAVRETRTSRIPASRSHCRKEACNEQPNGINLDTSKLTPHAAWPLLDVALVVRARRKKSNCLESVLGGVVPGIEPRQPPCKIGRKVRQHSRKHSHVNLLGVSSDRDERPVRDPSTSGTERVGLEVESSNLLCRNRVDTAPRRVTFDLERIVFRFVD